MMGLRFSRDRETKSFHVTPIILHGLQGKSR